MQRCLSIPQNSDDPSCKPASHDDEPTFHGTLSSSSRKELLKAWVKTRLASSSWRDALAAATSVSVLHLGISHASKHFLCLEIMTPEFTIYQEICEHLEATDHVTDAVECFQQMVGSLTGKTHGRGAKWIPGQ